METNEVPTTEMTIKRHKAKYRIKHEEVMVNASLDKQLTEEQITLLNKSFDSMIKSKAGMSIVARQFAGIAMKRLFTLMHSNNEKLSLDAVERWLTLAYGSLDNPLPGDIPTPVTQEDIEKKVDATSTPSATPAPVPTPAPEPPTEPKVITGFAR